MAEVIRMPLLSDTMKEGVIAAWHKKVGDTVKADDVLADVETDKATMEVVPYVDGTLLYLGVEEGKAAKVNEIIAIVGKPGEDFQSLLDGDEAQSSATEAAENNAPEEPAQQKTEAPKAPVAEKKASPKPGEATVIRMPLLSDTMTEGKILAWLKKVGDNVKSDDVIAEVETDKATMEVVPYVDGTLLYIGVEAGNAAKVNEIIAVVGKEGIDVAPYLDEEVSEVSASEEQPVAAAEQSAQPAATETPAAEQEDSSERLKISPLAKRLAEEKGIDLKELKGSGDGGRIIKRDVDQYTPGVKKQAEKPATPAAVQAIPVQSGEEYQDFPVSQMRRIIAQRLSESKFSAPHFYLRMTITMDKAIEARKYINNVSPVKVSFNDLIIKAAAMALQKHPEVNSSWRGDSVRRYNHIHIGTAVAIDDGLIVPVIRFANQKSLSQISADASELIDKARNKKLQPAEFTGNTFTISNLGMMDIDEFTAIINPPDSCILAVGKINAVPVVEEGEIVVRQQMKLTLSCDHRVVDGAVGARFMQTLKAYLENPVTMLA